MNISPGSITTRCVQLISSKKQTRYIASGVASEVIEYGSFFALLALTNALVASNSISFILGIGSGFLFHKFWSFAGEQQFQTRHQIIGYAILAACNFFLVNLLIVLFVHHLHMVAAVAKLLTMAITAAWSYLIFNKVIFRHTP